MRIFAIILLLCTTALAVSPTLESFNGGQVSPLMESRVSFPKYSSSLRTLENMLVTVQGPVERRPGTKFIASQRSSSAAGRITGFERSADDSYILLFEDQFLRFFTEGAQILTSVGTETIPTGNITAHYLMNSITGTVVFDDDGNTHDGTSSVDISTLTSEGKAGSGGFDLDGQYDVEITDADAFSFTDNSNDTTFSIACWGDITDDGGVQTLISKWRDDNATREWRLSLSNDRKLQLHLVDSSAALTALRIAQWKLNEAAADKIVLDTDASSHDGTSTVSDTTDISETGIISTCFNFAGSESVIITVADSELSFGDGSDDVDFTVAAWVFVTPATDPQTILSKWSDSTTTWEWNFRVQDDEKLGFILSDSDVTGFVWKTSDAILTSGWHFLTATYENDKSGSTDATAGTRVTLYVDGAAVAGTAGSSGGTYVAMEDTAEKVVIGAADSASPTQFFEDKIDNVMLFNAVLTPANISALYNSGAGTETMVSAEISAISDTAVTTGWHLFSSTYSAPATEATAADGIILYVDGVAVSSTKTNDGDYTAMQNGAEEVRLGSQRNSGDSANENFWADKMDEVSIYSDVLTPAEVAGLFSTGAYEIATPYLTADLADLNFTKNDDLVFIAHPSYKPRQLTRLGPASWTLTELDFQTGPFLPENDTATTIASSALTGSVTLTASTNIFKSASGASHVGSIWQFNQVGGSPSITGTFSANGISIATSEFSGGYSFTTSGTWTGNIVLQRSTNDGISWRNALVPLAADTNYDNPGETEEDGATYRAVMSNYGSGTATYNITVHDETNRGVVRITGVASGTSATATVLNDLVSTTATTQWREGYWSDFRGWPKAGVVHQQRLVFGGSTSSPQTIWFGKQDPDEFENFLEGTLDTSAFTIALEGQNQIRWLLSQDYMFIGTSGTVGKWGEQGKAVTPTSPNYQEQTRHGSAAIQAGLGGDAVLYVERGTRKVRQFSFDLQVDKYLSPDLTILSPEITESGITEIAFQLRPDPILWCVLGDGNIATLTYQRDQSIAAWAKQLTDGDFRSVAIIPGQSGTNENEVWVIAERTINSSQVFYIEQFQPQEWGSDDNDAWFVDAGITYDGVSTDTFTGADHLEAETVSIYADLLIESPEVVVSGGFTIDNAAERVLVGMAYTSKLETLPLVIDPQDRAKDKEVKSLWFDLYKTGAFQYGNGASSVLTNFNFKNNLDLDNATEAQDLDVDPATSIVRPVLCRWVYGSMKKQTIYLESSQPMPLTVRSITASYNFYGD